MTENYQSDYVTLKIKEDAHQSLVEAARRRYGDEGAVTWSYFIKELTDNTGNRDTLPTMEA